LSALPEIEAAFKRAASRAPDLEGAGADRALALLYLRAPGWPAGPGDPDLGLEHAKKAVAARADLPPHQLALAEAPAATGSHPAPPRGGLGRGGLPPGGARGLQPGSG